MKEIILTITSLTLIFGTRLFISHPNKVYTITPDFAGWLVWNTSNNYNVYWLLTIIFVEIVYFICNMNDYSKERKIYFSLILYLFIFPFLLIYFTHSFIIECYQPKYLIISLIPFYNFFHICYVIEKQNYFSPSTYIIIFYILSSRQIEPQCFFNEYILGFAIKNQNNINRPIIIIDKHSMYIKYYKYHIDNYAVLNNIYFIDDFDNDKIIEEIDKAVAKNNNRYIWLIDATSTYDINEISSKKNIVKINKNLPSVYYI